MLFNSYLNGRTINLLYRFYLNFCLVSVIITLASMALLYQLGPGAAVIILWFKIITIVIFAWYINSYKRKEFYYYRNLGLSKSKLFACTLGFDLVVFGLLMVLTHLVR